MKAVWGRAALLAAALLGGCRTIPQPYPTVFSEDIRAFTHGGYRFEARIDGDLLRVRVPCCQTYEADLAFRALLLEGVQSQIGCTLADPDFTDGWIGPWQMQAVMSCEDTGAPLRWRT